MKVIHLIKAAWKNRDRIGDGTQDRELAAFLPAALEIQSTPPNPIAKWLARSLMLLFIIALIWMLVGQINIVASAEGKIIPSARVKKIQPLEKAVVKKILVKEGQYVQQGEALIEMDNTLTSSDRARVGAESEAIKNNLSLNETFLDLLSKSESEQVMIRYQDIKLDDNFSYKNLLWQQWQQYRSQQKSLKKSLLKSQAEQAASYEQITKLKQVLPIIFNRTAKVKQLYQDKFASEDEYLRLEQERIETVQDLAREKQGYKQLQASIDETKERLKSFIAQKKSEQLTKITDYQRQLESTNNELIKAIDLNAKKILYAPVAGRVQSLAVSTIGGVVTEAQELMLIVPTEEKLEVQVFIDNKDIGYVYESMPAEIKIHTFPFTKYGIVNAEVTHVSNDAILDEQRGLVYSMHLTMHKNTLPVNGKAFALMPGMQVTAELQTGKRRIIEFFLAPLMRAKHESIRER